MLLLSNNMQKLLNVVISITHYFERSGIY